MSDVEMDENDGGIHEHNLCYATFFSPSRAFRHGFRSRPGPRGKTGSETKLSLSDEENRRYVCNLLSFYNIIK